MLMITSFNEKLLKKYGKQMVQEFSENSDGTIKLVVIYEGVQIPDIFLKNVEFVKLDHSGHHEFMSKFGHFIEARGIKIKYKNDTIKLIPDYRFDAVRFSFKIFSLLQALELFKPIDYFAWLDADIRCLKNFSASDFIQFFPDEDQLMSYLGRTNFPKDAAYSENGFVGFNNKHSLTSEFLNRIADIYRNGEIFTHKQWHDSWIFDQTRLEFERREIKFKNISGAAASAEHPFINTNLGKFFDHLKGPARKESGHSFAEDYNF